MNPLKTVGIQAIILLGCPSFLVGVNASNIRAIVLLVLEVLMVQWLGALAHSRKVAGSIPAHAIGLFRWNLQQIP